MVLTILQQHNLIYLCFLDVIALMTSLSQNAVSILVAVIIEKIAF